MERYKTHAGQTNLQLSMYYSRIEVCSVAMMEKKKVYRLVLCSIVCHQHFSFWMRLCVRHNMDVGKTFA